jgi:ferredoxin
MISVIKHSLMITRFVAGGMAGTAHKPSLGAISAGEIPPEAGCQEAADTCPVEAIAIVK